jgi:hypothetical protein
MCDQLVTRLDEYSNTLLRHLQRFLDVGDRRGAEVIQNSCAACLAHLAVLCDLISGLEPNSKPQMDAVCDSSLERLGHLARGMRIDGYTYLDVLLGVRHYITRADAERLTKALEPIQLLYYQSGWSIHCHKIPVWLGFTFPYIGRTSQGCWEQYFHTSRPVHQCMVIPGSM